MSDKIFDGTVDVLQPDQDNGVSTPEWFALTDDDGIRVYASTEEIACWIQRKAREDQGLDPITGEPTSVNVFVVRIDHKHGHCTTVHLTPEGAAAALAEWARDSWNDIMTGPPPTDEGEMVRDYFQRAGEIGTEFYGIEETTVER